MTALFLFIRPSPRRPAPSAAAAAMEFVSPEGLRQDGRRSDEVRRLSVRYHPCLPSARAASAEVPEGCAAESGGPPHLADGHCSFATGQTVAHAYVYGPRDAKDAPVTSAEDAAGLGDAVRRNAARAPGGGVLGGGGRAYGTLTANVTHVGFVRGKRPAAHVTGLGGAGTSRRAAANAARKSPVEEEQTETLRATLASAVDLKLYAESEIHVHVDVVSGDGGELAACINAAYLALLDAGIAVSDALGAVTVGVFPPPPKDEKQRAPTTLLDLTGTEFGMCPGVRATVACFDRGGIAALVLDGAPADAATIERLVLAGRDACRTISAAMRTEALKMLRLRAAYLG